MSGAAPRRRLRLADMLRAGVAATTSRPGSVASVPNPAGAPVLARVLGPSVSVLCDRRACPERATRTVTVTRTDGEDSRDVGRSETTDHRVCDVHADGLATAGAHAGWLVTVSGGWLDVSAR